MITAYYTKSELEAATKVSDKELNELLQEIREKDDRFYLIERKISFKPGLFKKPTELTNYTLLLNTGNMECQMVNFCQDFDYSINIKVSKSYIYTFFVGWLNGYKRVDETKKIIYPKFPADRIEKGEDVPEEFKGTLGKLDMKMAVDSLAEGPESKGIPEELKGTSGQYWILMERLIERQKEMDPVWFKAHALSIVLRAYCRGMDVVYNYFEKLKKERKAQ